MPGPDARSPRPRSAGLSTTWCGRMAAGRSRPLTPNKSSSLTAPARSGPTKNQTRQVSQQGTKMAEANASTGAENAPQNLTPDQAADRIEALLEAGPDTDE